MTFKPCLIVPAYNSGPALTRTLEALLATGLEVFVHDDGSAEATRETLRAFASAHPTLHLSRWDVNQGKGRGVCELLRRAHAAGFTHALQVDSDGQHDAASIAPFLALGEAHPNAVIAGVPAYDHSVPPARRYGRWITHAWVWLETLSFDIGDSLCGFRLYPLAPTCALLDRVTLPARMDFDTAAIVRLYWAGVPVINAPVKVVYPEDGVSHFHFLRDNARLFRLHTGLVLGMLWRLPLLLWRKVFPKRHDSGHWTKVQERGTALGLRITLWTYKLLGARGLRFVVEFVAGYFFFTGKATRRSSATYLERLHATFGPLPELRHAPRWTDRYRHVRTFAMSYVDRFLAWMDAADTPVDFPKEAAFDALRASGQGALFISGHIGNLDMLRGLGASRGLPGLNAVIYSEHVVRFQDLLKEINPRYNLDLIHIADVGPGTAMLLEEKVSKGECLFIVGDRSPASENGRTLPIPFLGKAAPFPIGPIFLAHLLQCPVYLFFCVKQEGRYRIHMEKLADRISLPRQNREDALRQWLQRYAQTLEAHCKEAPFQWFNFYDFWAEDAAPLSKS
jgi:predicted LPLAT superfamily acyltransferase